MSDEDRKTDRPLNESATVSHLQKALGSERIIIKQMTTAHLNTALSAEKPAPAATDKPPAEKK